MAVLNTSAASLMDQVQLDPKSPANINYVKARMAIEAANLPRAMRRTAKMTVISYLKGALHHPTPAEKATGATKQVVFPDNSKARF